MAVTLILGQMLWADTRQAPEADWGVAVEGGRVIATNSCADLCAQFPEASVVDARDCVITPAFVNAHHHMYGILSHGIPLEKAPAGFWPFLEDFWWPQVEDQLTHELIAAAVDWACLEMIRSGSPEEEIIMEYSDGEEAHLGGLTRWHSHGIRFSPEKIATEDTSRARPASTANSSTGVGLSRASHTAL